jgi:hypothetical protein
LTARVCEERGGLRIGSGPLHPRSTFRPPQNALERGLKRFRCARLRVRTRNESRKPRADRSADDGMAAAPKTPCFLGFLEFLSRHGMRVMSVIREPR